jgi:predicted nucleic acid-binding protein
MGYAIVVDVSVARGAGTSGKPEPESCRRALAALRDSGHRVAMSSDVFGEWIKVVKTKNGLSRPYASIIAIQWLKDMRSSGRVDDIALEKDSELRRRAIMGLQSHNRISSSAGPVAKDFHLVETAMKSDMRVLSLDQRMFGHLGNLQEIINEVCTIMWVNPINDPAEEWLMAGAPDTLGYHVCVYHG